MHRLTATDTPMVRYTRTIFPSYAAESEARNVTSYITSLILKDLKEKELV